MPIMVRGTSSTGPEKSCDRFSRLAIHEVADTNVYSGEGDGSVLDLDRGSEYP